MDFLRKMTDRAKIAPKASVPLPEKIVRILQESRWLALIVLAFLLGLSLFTYHHGDPGWSHAKQDVGIISNLLGKVGAFIADMLLSAFGFSVWWLIFFLVALVWWGYRPLDRLRMGKRRPFYCVLTGFIIVFIASCALEYLRFYSHSAFLPQGPGGIIGNMTGSLFVNYLGYTGATFALLAMLVFGWSVFSGMSWLILMERTGTLLELLYASICGLIDRWRDRQIGRETAKEREAIVED